MLTQLKKAICAWMSLMFEKHEKGTPFELREVLFTKMVPLSRPRPANLS